jgi:molecular chaperone DnaK
MEGEDTAEIKKLTEELTQASHKLAESMYAKAAEQAQAAGGGGADGSTAAASQDEDVVDADFEEVKK